MKRLDQKGFSAVEVLVVIVIVGLIGTVGWLVYDRQQSKNNATTTTSTKTEPTQQLNETPATPKAESEFSLNKKLTSLNSKFTLNVPDGWVFTNDTELDYAYAREAGMNYKEGTAATINNEYGHRGGGYAGTTFVIQYSKDAQSNYFSASEPDGSLKLNNGDTVKKYKYVGKGGEDGMTKGTVSYGYYARVDNGSIVLSYRVNKGDTSQKDLVEASIKTLDY